MTNIDPSVWAPLVRNRLNELTEGCETIQEIVGRLSEAGCRGGKCGGDCPLYRWLVIALQERLPVGFYFWVNRFNVVIRRTRVSVPLPIILTSFIDMHDEDEFPDLYRKPGRKDQE